MTPSLVGCLVDERTLAVVTVVGVRVRVGLAEEVTAGANDLAVSRSAGRRSNTVVRRGADGSGVTAVVDIRLGGEASAGVSRLVEGESRVATGRASTSVGVADVVTVGDIGARLMKRIKRKHGPCDETPREEEPRRTTPPHDEAEATHWVPSDPPGANPSLHR